MLASPKPLIRQPKLELNASLLEKMRDGPSQQIQFYEAIQQSMQDAEKTPPKLINSTDTSVNPGKKSKLHISAIF